MLSSEIRLAAPYKWLYAVLLVSLFLRVDLILSGGQFYWPDENRYAESQRILESIVRGDLKDPGNYTFVNVERIHPEPTIVQLPPHTVLMQAAHPLEFLPYQYEGYDPSQRHKLRIADLTMRLVVFVSE